MNEFKNYHPIVNFIYFAFVIGFSMFFMHPICLFISFFCCFTYSIMLKGKNAVKENLIYMMPMMIITALINPLFNHEGATVLTYFVNGNPLTLESIIYGLSAAIMLCNTICYFSCYNKIMTSDKFLYLFGSIIPSMSLIISMTLRFVPNFINQFKNVSNAQKCIGKDLTNGNILKKIKNGLSILSIMVTWAFENSVETADSMNARGDGVTKRTAFSIYTLDKRDKKALITFLFLGIYILVGYLNDGMYFKFFPSIMSVTLSSYSFSVFFAYFALSISPIIIEIWEALKWKVLKSKI